MEWISVNNKRPLLIEGENESERVWAWLNGDLAIMVYGWVDDGDNSGYAWFNCYESISLSPEFDDDYHPTHWMPMNLPTEPK